MMFLLNRVFGRGEFQGNWPKRNNTFENKHNDHNVMADVGLYQACRLLLCTQCPDDYNYRSC
jgi:hypothetical protein